MFKITEISIAIFIATLLNIFTAYISWKRRKTKGGTYFAFAILSLTFWTLVAGFDYAAVPVSLKIFFAKLESIGYGSALPLLAAFSITYSGNEQLLKKAWIRILMVVLPLSSILLIMTDSLHGWVWSGWTMSETADNVLIFKHGPAFTWITFTGYFFIVIILISLLIASFTGNELSRKQARMLLAALIIPVSANLIYLTGVSNTPGVDWSSITFSFTGLFFLAALYGSRFLDIVPIARNILIENMADGILVFDDQGYLVDINPVAQAIFNIQKEDLWASYQVALARWPSVVAFMEDPGDSSDTEIVIGDPAKVFNLRLTKLKDQRKRTYGQLMVMQDVTERKRAEEALRKNEAHFREVFDNTAHGTFIVDMTEDGALRVGDSNRAEEMLTGIPRDSIKGKTMEEIFPPDVVQVLRANYDRAIQAGKAISYEEDFVLPGVGTKSFFTTIAPLKDASGRYYRFIGSTLEISERRRMEDELRVSEERFRTLLMSLPDAIFGTDEDGQITFANEAAARLFGYSIQELVGRDVGLLLPAGVREIHVQLRKNYIANHQGLGALEASREVEAWHKDGRAIPVEIRLGHMRTTQGILVITVMRDITERQLSEQRLQQAQEQLMEQQRTLAVIEERQRVARNLHDSVSQSLHGLNLFSETLTAALAKNNRERAMQLAERLQESARQALKEARLMLFQLQSSGDGVVVDLLREIEARLSTVERRAGVRASFVVEGNLDEFPDAWMENLYRIVIEALNNALKYAEAREVNVNLYCFPPTLELTVSDNGIGFDLTRVRAGGMGLRSMRERVALLDGTLQIQSAPGKGSTVMVRIPKKDKP